MSVRSFVLHGRFSLIFAIVTSFLETDAPNAVVHFMVTSLEHDIVKSNGSRSYLDSYVSATMGEMGCWIDPSVTRVIQAGVEHSFVPGPVYATGTYSH